MIVEGNVKPVVPANLTGAIPVILPPVAPVQTGVSPMAGAAASPLSVAASSGPASSYSAAAARTQTSSIQARAPWWQTTSAAMGGVLGMVAPADAQAEPSKGVVGRVADAVGFDPTVGIFGLSWERWGGLAFVAGAALFLNRIIGKKIAKLEEQRKMSMDGEGEFSVRSGISATGLKVIRGLMWGAAAYSGLRIVGVDLTNVVAGSGVLAAAVAFAAKDITNNLGALIAIGFRGDLNVGDRIVVYGVSGRDVSGKVVAVSYSSVDIHGVDENGVERVFSIPPSAILSSVTAKVVYDQDTLDKIVVNDWIGVSGKGGGRVVCITEYTIGVEVENAEGGTEVRHIQKHEITGHSLTYHSNVAPPSAGGAKPEPAS